MNTLEKLAQVNKAARHVLRTRQVKKAYPQSQINWLKYLAETGQLAPEVLEVIKREHDKGRLVSALQSAGTGGLKSGLLGAGLGAFLSAVTSKGPIGQPMLEGASVVGGGTGLLGAGISGIADLVQYNRKKKQLKSILDAANANAPQPSVETTPESELATAASV